MAVIRAEEIKAVCLDPIAEAPERLRQFFANAVYDLDGLETALYSLSGGVVDEALERMRMWHPEFAHFGYRGWAERYFAEVERKNRFTLPNILTSGERTYLEAWRANLLSLIDRSSHVVERQASAP